MDVLIDILQSVSYSLITTILPSHIAYFKNINNIILEKIKLQNITKEIFFIDVLFQKYINYKNVITFGTSFDSNFFYKLDNLKIIIKDINCNKEYFIKALFHEGINHCIVVAFTLCYILKIKVENIINAVENFNNVVGRFSIHNLKKGGVIINDCYNAANHIVMLKSIEAFKLFETNKKKIIVLADMLEQGELNEIYHNIVVENVDNILDSCIEKVFYIGDSFSLSAKNSKKNTVIAKQFADVEDQVYEYLDLKYCILFKGSNGMKLFENINKYIKKEKDL
jgi:UDP-N-acetylmuramyl pentapeptide synthase